MPLRLPLRQPPRRAAGQRGSWASVGSPMAKQCQDGFCSDSLLVVAMAPQPGGLCVALPGRGSERRQAGHLAVKARRGRCGGRGTPCRFCPDSAAAQPRAAHARTPLSEPRQGFQQRCHLRACAWAAQGNAAWRCVLSSPGESSVQIPVIRVIVGLGEMKRAVFVPSE